MFSYFLPESRVSADHPLRGMKAHADFVLKELLVDIDALYAETGRPSVRSDTMFRSAPVHNGGVLPVKAMCRAHSSSHNTHQVFHEQQQMVWIARARFKVEMLVKAFCILILGVYE
jgi:hypothetical protein